MPEIVTRGELTGPVLQHHNLRVTVEAGDSKRVRCRWPKTFRECHLICWTDGLSAEEYDQVVVESLLDLIENIVIERLCQVDARSEEHTSELQSRTNLVCRLLLEKKKTTNNKNNKKKNNNT